MSTISSLQDQLIFLCTHDVNNILIIFFVLDIINIVTDTKTIDIETIATDSTFTEATVTESTVTEAAFTEADNTEVTNIKVMDTEGDI